LLEITLQIFTFSWFHSSKQSLHARSFLIFCDPLWDFLGQ
jgi:hypothetical protein